MKQVLLWGTGKVAERTFEQCKMLSLYNICGFIDSNPQKWGTFFHNIQVYSPDDQQIQECKCDIIVILADAFDEISVQIHKKIPGFKGKIENKYYFYKESILKKYEGTDDPELLEVLTYLKNNSLEIFNYEYVKEYMNVNIEISFDDSCGLFFTNYMNKKMYFSRKFNTEDKAREYYKSLLLEQDNRSPHKYCDEMFKPENGDTVVDVGAAEGNFALEYIDDVSEIYLIEPDSDWVEALQHTFENYKNKVHIIQSFIGAFNEVDICQKLDTLIDKEIDFLKMDIEGAEWDALRGAREIIQKSSNIKMSICVYHSDYDQTLIENFMDEAGICHNSTLGYMWFPYSYRQTYISTELHRGVIRGYKVK